MARYTGRCEGCGDDASPRGNVFTVQPTYLFVLENVRGHDVPPTAFVKVCNNCQRPHPFRPRVSSRAKDREALITRLLASGDRAGD